MLSTKHWLKFVILLIFFCISICIAYYIYTNYLNQTTYSANREGLENNEEKQAEIKEELTTLARNFVIYNKSTY